MAVLGLVLAYGVGAGYVGHAFLGTNLPEPFNVLAALLVALGVATLAGRADVHVRG